ncbi:dihydroneopterin aldolase [Patescibacteria group bacterium]|nr:dihydroneopterin aldolase [Patescibacteria group bacterium]MBP9709843.1 dihydroneopterin aldolase [Patescibacteria group bacterium]
MVTPSLFVSACSTIFLENMRVSCRIGVPEEERLHPQTILVTVRCKLGDLKMEKDEMEVSLNYHTLADQIRALGKTSHSRKLLETFTHEIAEICFLDERVQEVCVEAKKPDRFEDVAYVGVERVFRRL